ncbi:MAG: hypothetical protein HYT62_02745 [Candidatus Yanofskybacteria bacterium]|nr:hypothetical protein [Candidatus Yanofskybacteria bacterium]
MANQGFEQIKEYGPTKSTPQKIDLGWKGYVPGYKNRVIRDINRQISEQSSEYAEPTARLPRGPVERPSGFKESSSPIETAAQERQAVQEEAEFLETSDRMTDLALNQEVNQAEQTVDGLNDRIAYFKHPSVLKYLLIFLPLALLVDGLDLIGYLAAPTVIGITITIVLFFVCIYLNSLIIFLFWFTDSKLKEAKRYPSLLNLTIADNVARVKELRILNQGRSALRAAQTSQKTARTTEEIAAAVEGIEKATEAIRAAKVTARTAKGVRLVTSVTANPLVRLGAGAGLNAFPILALFPFMSLAVVLSYLSERKIYRQARESAEQAKQEILASLVEVV